MARASPAERRNRVLEMCMIALDPIRISSASFQQGRENNCGFLQS